MLISGLRNSKNPARTSLEYAMFIVCFVIFSSFGVLKYFGILQNLILFLGLGIGLAIAQQIALRTAKSRQTVFHTEDGYRFRMVNSDGIVIGTSGKKTHRRHLADDVLQNFIITLCAMMSMLVIAWIVRGALRHYGY